MKLLRRRCFWRRMIPVSSLASNYLSMVAERKSSGSTIKEVLWPFLPTKHAGIEANRQTRRCRGRSCVSGVGCSALDYWCEYSCGRGIKALRLRSNEHANTALTKKTRKLLWIRRHKKKIKHSCSKLST